MKKFKKLSPDIGTGFVYFDEVNHKYYDEEGNPMMSGSAAESIEVGEPDMTYPAKAMAKSTGINEEKIPPIP